MKTEHPNVSPERGEGNNYSRNNVQILNSMTYVFYDIVHTETVIYETNLKQDLN